MNYKNWEHYQVKKLNRRVNGVGLVCYENSVTFLLIDEQRVVQNYEHFFFVPYSDEISWKTKILQFLSSPLPPKIMACILPKLTRAVSGVYWE